MYISCHGYVSLYVYIVTIFCILFTFPSKGLLEGKLCHGLTPGDLLKKSETDSKGRLFLKITMFLGQKIDKNWERFKVVKFFFYYSIKCRFHQILFRSNVISMKCRSIKCRFDQVSFRSNVVSINCRVTIEFNL